MKTLTFNETYSHVLARLKSYAPKRLITRALSYMGEHCAIGVCVPGFPESLKYLDLDSGVILDSYAVRKIEEFNDGIGVTDVKDADQPSRERYDRVVAWLEGADRRHAAYVLQESKRRHRYADEGIQA